MSRSCSSMLISSCSAIVDANNARASRVASGTPTSQNTTWRPDSRRVSGPNIGWIDVTLQPAATSCSSPARSGLLSEPMSMIKPLGLRSASASKIPPAIFIGVATMMRS